MTPAIAASLLRQRPAAAADAAFLVELFASTRAAEVERLGAGSPLAAAFIAMQFAARERGYRGAHPAAVCSVVESHGSGAVEAIGQLWLDTAAERLTLLDISLLPAWRGAGCGTALLRGLIASAQQLGRPLRLQVAHDNPALRLYRRLGFAESGVDGLHLTMCWRPALPNLQPIAETFDEQA